LGREATKPISADALGHGNCYGFVALALGYKPPKGIDPRQVSFSAVKGKDEKYFAQVTDKVGEYRVPSAVNPKILDCWVYPAQGLFAYLTQGRKTTKSPNFGAVALFYYNAVVKTTHAAFVLGRSSNGTVYLLQKLNSDQGIVVTPSTHPRLQGFGTPTYYQ
jgi:hypothetical protein